MKKLSILLCLTILTTALMSGCSLIKKENDKLKVVTTLFPQYDFARTIGGDKAEVKLLLKPGVDSHSYEPTGSDMMDIADSDIFIYTGKSMEVWAETILDSINSDTLKITDVSAGIDIAMTNESSHEHGENHTHNVYDPHIWTSPANAKIIAENILNSFVSADPENADYYRENANRLLNELDALDKDFESFFAGCSNKKIIFGGRFAMHYFAERYNLEYEAAYDTCSTEGEASPGKIAELIDCIKSENLKAVYYEELADPAVAKTIASETGTQALLLHSCHNVSKEDFDNGETYISLMRKNLENLKKGMY